MDAMSGLPCYKAPRYRATAKAALNSSTANVPGPSNPKPSTASGNGRDRAVIGNTRSGNGSYVCLLCEEKGHWPCQKDIQEHMGSKHGSWFKLRGKTIWTSSQTTQPTKKAQ